MQKTTQTLISSLLIALGLAFGDEASKPNPSSVVKPFTVSKPKSSVKPKAKVQTKTLAKTQAKTKTKSSAGPMQVDEPNVKSAPLRESKVSKAKRTPAIGLTEEQKTAFRLRKEKMQSMITLITEKRRALQSAKPDERAALARELHSMILERESGTASVAAHINGHDETKKIILAPPVTPEVEVNSPTSEQLFQMQQQQWRDQRLSP